MRILASWDGKAGVWRAESDDVPGLAAEADTIPDLLVKLKMLLPEILMDGGDANGQREDIPFELLASVTTSAPGRTH